jgi:hypothetical protein
MKPIRRIMKKKINSTMKINKTVTMIWSDKKVNRAKNRKRTTMGKTKIYKFELGDCIFY